MKDYTVEPLLKDTPNEGHHRNYLLKKDTSKAPKIDFPILPIHFLPLKSGQPLYSGQNSWSQCVLYREIPCIQWSLGNPTCISKTTSIFLIMTKILQSSIQ